jgi:hypothetical protein
MRCCITGLIRGEEVNEVQRRVNVCFELLQHARQCICHVRKSITLSLKLPAHCLLLYCRPDPW